mmetsp:Transcript_88148/g.221898  ORF Transcript_88148/g.221898 Transcript_88148/m.221898 type:complete len:558 (+) Transcript_88148:54-1727(+)
MAFVAEEKIPRAVYVCEVPCCRDVGIHVEYCLVVTHRSGLRWQAWRRFSEFIQLHEELTRDMTDEQAETLPEPPQKSWLPSFTQSTEFRDHRQRELQTYVAAVISQPELVRSLAVQNLLGVQPPDQPAGLRVVPRNEEHELEVRPSSHSPKAKPIDKYRVVIVNLETGSAHTFFRDVGSRGRRPQQARIGRLMPGKHHFVVSAANLAGCSAPTSVIIDIPADLRATSVAAGAHERHAQPLQVSQITGQAWQSGAKSNQGFAPRQTQVLQPPRQMSSLALERPLQHRDCRAPGLEAEAGRHSPRVYRRVAIEGRSPHAEHSEVGIAVASASAQADECAFHTSPTPSDGGAPSCASSIAAKVGQTRPGVGQRMLVCDSIAAAFGPAQHLPQHSSSSADRIEIGLGVLRCPETCRGAGSHEEAGATCSGGGRHHASAAAVPSTTFPRAASTQCNLRHRLEGLDAAQAAGCSASPPVALEHPEISRSAARGGAAAAEDDDDEDDNICIVCMAEPKSHAFIPCGHRCVCMNCSAGILEARRQTSVACPMCRAPTTGSIQIFM